MRQIRMWNTSVKVGDLLKVSHTEKDGTEYFISGSVAKIERNKAILSCGFCCTPEDTLELHKADAVMPR